MQLRSDKHAGYTNSVKSGNFGHEVNSDRYLVCFIFQLLEYKNKLTKQTVNILMERLSGGAISSEFSLFANVCPKLPSVRSYLTLSLYTPCALTLCLSWCLRPISHFFGQSVGLPGHSSLTLFSSL